jgi:Histidine kinase sensor domain
VVSSPTLQRRMIRGVITRRLRHPQFLPTPRRHPRAPVLVELVRSRFTGDWAIVFAHKVSGPRGEFLGVVTRATTPASFEHFFASVALGESAAISMYHRDGTLLARYPHIEAMIGKNFATGQMHREILSRSDHGTMRLSSPLDALDRLASVRTLADFPVSIIATTTVAAALADWREQTRYLVAVAGFSVLVIAVMLFLVVRKLSQQHQLEKQRLDTAVNNIPQGLVVYDPAGAGYRLQPALPRDVRVVTGRGQARLHDAGSDLTSQGNRIL